MITFILCLAVLIGGYFIYGSYVYKQAALDENISTPAITMQDGIDYIPMPLYKVLLIQFLNIAGTGPIFGYNGCLFWSSSIYMDNTRDNTCRWCA